MLYFWAVIQLDADEIKSEWILPASRIFLDSSGPPKTVRKSKTSIITILIFFDFYYETKPVQYSADVSWA